jgi:hypothetical protein
MTSDSLHRPAAPLRSARPATARLTRWLSLGAAPVFAAMAVLAGAHCGDGGTMPGMDMPDPSPLTGMTPMYVLMSVFHLAPWLKLVSRWRSGARGGRAPYHATSAYSHPIRSSSQSRRSQ